MVARLRKLKQRNVAACTGGDMYFGGGYAHRMGGLTKFWPQARLKCQLVEFPGV